MKLSHFFILSLLQFQSLPSHAVTEKPSISDEEIEVLTEGYLEAINASDVKKLNHYATPEFIESMKWAGALEDKLRAMKTPYTADQVDAVEISEVPYIQLTLTDRVGEKVPASTSWLMLKKIDAYWKIHALVDDL
ncbi:MAG: hypothetical protein K2X47_06095 [Bdellovibrionales bacterium]|nr:hypothetical protein [Bdellovibrionales bacterium]